MTTSTFAAPTEVQLVGAYKQDATDSWSVDQASIVAIKVGEFH